MIVLFIVTKQLNPIIRIKTHLNFVNVTKRSTLKILNNILPFAVTPSP